MTLRFHAIGRSLVDGPGARFAVWLQGCPIHCPGCQNPALWPASRGYEAPTLPLAARLLVEGLPITITGGEPFFQPEALAALLADLRRLQPAVHILVYSGYTWDDLLALSEAIPAIRDALARVDVLVDGPYVAALDHDWMQYRGSANQRVIDVPATLANLPDAEPVLLDWDSPTLTLTPDGRLLAAAALAADFTALGPGVDARRCGEPLSA